MRRRDFLRQSTVAAGLAGSLRLLQPAKAGESSPPKPSQPSSPVSMSAGAAQEENRSAEYLRRAQEDKLLPKPPMVADSSRPDSVVVQWLTAPEGRPAEVHLKLGRHKPLDWANWVT
jgi:hypothetical protein